MSEQRLLQIQQSYDSKLAEYKRLGKTDAEFVYVQLADYTFLLSELAALRKERDKYKETLEKAYTETMRSPDPVIADVNELLAAALSETEGEKESGMTYTGPLHEVSRERKSVHLSSVVEPDEPQAEQGED